MRRIKVIVLPVVILILAFGAWATVGASAEESSRSNQSLPVVVGAILPFTGSEADVASEEKNAMELELNESGRDRLKVIYKDSVGLSPRAEDAFKELVDEENASVVITCAAG